jgi:hypothetical protein
MPSLLDPNTILQFRNAIKDVTDTFLQLPIVYRKAGGMPDRWGEKDSQQFINTNLLSMYVESDNQTSTVTTTAKGAYDVNDGYFLFNFDDLDALGLIQNGLPTFQPATDYIIANSETYEVLGAPPLGQLADRFTLVKVIVKKIVNAL